MSPVDSLMFLSAGKLSCVWWPIQVSWNSIFHSKALFLPLVTNTISYFPQSNRVTLSLRKFLQGTRVGITVVCWSVFKQKQCSCRVVGAAACSSPFPWGSHHTSLCGRNCILPFHFDYQNNMYLSQYFIKMNFHCLTRTSRLFHFHHECEVVDKTRVASTIGGQWINSSQSGNS